MSTPMISTGTAATAATTSGAAALLAVAPDGTPCAQAGEAFAALMLTLLGGAGSETTDQGAGPAAAVPGPEVLVAGEGGDAAAPADTADTGRPADPSLPADATTATTAAAPWDAVLAQATSVVVPLVPATVAVTVPGHVRASATGDVPASTSTSAPTPAPASAVPPLTSAPPATGPAPAAGQVPATATVSTTPATTTAATDPLLAARPAALVTPAAAPRTAAPAAATTAPPAPTEDVTAPATGVAPTALVVDRGEGATGDVVGQLAQVATPTDPPATSPQARAADPAPTGSVTGVPTDSGDAPATTTAPTTTAASTPSAVPAATSPDPGTVTSPTTAAVAAPAPSAPVAAPADVATSQLPRAVAAQVVPELTRLVSRGDGTHRITLELNPRALGDVRVVMTVRDGAVQVRLAAGDQARQVLGHTAHDLVRALESAGFDDHRIVLAGLGGPADAAAVVVRDRPTTDRNPFDPTQQQTQHHTPGGHHQPQQHDHHSGKGVGSTATEGSPIRRTVVETTVPSSAPATDGVRRGLDVRM